MLLNSADLEREKYKNTESICDEKKKRVNYDGIVEPLTLHGDDSRVEVEDILSQPRNFMYVEAVSKGDELSEMDKVIIERQNKKIQEEIESKCADCSRVKTEKPDKLIAIITDCTIPGCVVHTISHSGRIIRHYKDSELHVPGERLSKGYEVWRRYYGCSCVEIYQNHIAVIKGAKTVIVKE